MKFSGVPRSSTRISPGCSPPRMRVTTVPSLPTTSSSTGRAPPRWDRPLGGGRARIMLRAHPLSQGLPLAVAGQLLRLGGVGAQRGVPQVLHPAAQRRESLRAQPVDVAGAGPLETDQAG